MSRRAATAITSIWRSPSGRLPSGNDSVIEHRLVERHRDLVLRLEADRGLDLLRVLDQRQLHGPDDHALVGDPEPDQLAELVLREERSCSALDRASASRTSPSLTMPGSSGAIAVRLTCARAVGLDLGGGDAAGLDVEADDRLGLLAGGEHWSVIVGAVSCAPTLHRPREAASPYPRVMNVGLAAGCPASGRSGSDMPVDHLAAGEQPDDAAERQEGAERDRLLAGLGAVPQHQRRPRRARPARSRRTAPGTIEPPRKRPITAASFTSPIPIPRGIGERGDAAGSPRPRRRPRRRSGRLPGSVGGDDRERRSRRRRAGSRWG